MSARCDRGKAPCGGRRPGDVFDRARRRQLPGLRHRRSQGCRYQVHAVIDRSRPTVNKNAIVVGGYRLLKVDTLDNRSISDQILEDITGAIKKVPTDAVVFADFRHGLFNPPHHPRTGAGAARGLLPRRGQPGRKPLGQHHRLPGFDLITPNEREARFALGDQDSGIRPLASNLYDSSRCGLSSSSWASAACWPAAIRTMSRSTASSSSTVSWIGLSTRLVRAMRCSPIQRSRCSRPGSRHRDHPRHHGRGGRMRMRRQHPGDRRRSALEDRRHRAADGAGLSASPMRVVVAGLGVQGHNAAGSPAPTLSRLSIRSTKRRYRTIMDVPLADYDAVLACIPDEPKIEVSPMPRAMASTCWSRSRCGPGERHRALEALARRKGVVLYRLQPSVSSRISCACAISIASGELSTIYSACMFYGNGTARLVRDSTWRDQGSGRAARSRPASPRHLSLLVRRYRRPSSNSSVFTASRTALRIMSSSIARKPCRGSNWK